MVEQMACGTSIRSIDETMQLHYYPLLAKRAEEVSMNATLEVESTLTDRYQTTVPETVRRALKLGKRDKVHYSIRPDGDIVLTRAATVAVDDPVLSQFLGFLATDIARHPERVHRVDASLMKRIQSLVGKVEIDLDAALSADDE